MQRLVRWQDYIGVVGQSRVIDEFVHADSVHQIEQDVKVTMAVPVA